MGRQTRRRPLVTAAAGLVSLILVVTSTLFAVLGDATTPTTTPGEALPTSTGPGDPALAARLSGRADALRRTDPLAELQLRLAAHTLDPDNTAYRSALAQLLLGPRPLGEATVTIGPVTALAFATSGRLAVGGHNGVQEITGDPDALTAGAPSGLADVSAVGYTADDQLVAGTSDGVQVPSTPSARGGAAVAIHALVRLGTTGWAATTRDGRLVVWDAPTPTGTPSRILAAGLGAASPVAADPTGRYLYAPDPGRGVTVWDPAAGTIAGRLPVVGPVRDLSAGGHGLLLVAQGSTATLWDVTTPSAPRLAATLVHPAGPVATVALAPDGRTALTSGSGTTLVWQLPASGDPSLLVMLPGREHVVAAYRSDSTVVATASDSTVQTWSITELLVDRPGQVQPQAVLHGTLGAAEPITYAATNTTGSYVITSGASQPAIVWSTETLGQDRRLDRAGTLASPVTGTYAVGDLLKTTTVTFGGQGGASAWQVVSPGITSPSGHLTAAADTAAVTPDGNTAVVVAGTTGTVYDLSLNPRPIATLSYPLPTTALAFAPQGTVLIAGHADGSATVHTIDLNQLHADTHHLASGRSRPIDAIALSANDAVAVGTDTDGTISVWTIGGDDHPVTVAGGASPGPHRVWLSAAGDFAIITSHGRAVLWSLVDRRHPAILATLLTTPTGRVPVLISGNGSAAVQISDDALTVWNIQPIIDVVNNPDARACQLADLGYQRWRELVPNPTFNTPCLPPPLPQLGNSTTPTPAPS